MSSVEEQVRAIADRVAKSLGLEIWDLEFRGAGGKARLLRIFIDGPEGVTLEHCENVSREVSTILDIEDPIKGAYTLEVSSPGLDRKLVKPADFSRFAGSRVKLMTRQPVDNNRHFEGRLEKFEDGRLTLDLSVASHKSRKKMGDQAGQKIEIDFANVEKANLVPEI
jgi:ribosome maturation factor RimP